MYRVLVGVDPDLEAPEQITEAISSLPEAERNVTVTLLNVFEKFSVTGPESGTVDSDEMFDENDFPEAGAVLRDQLTDAGIETTTIKRHGEVAAEILAAAAEVDTDVIILGGRKRSPVGKALFGSVAQTVLLEADRPVTVVRTD